MKLPQIPSYEALQEVFPDALQQLIQRTGGVFLFASLAITLLKENNGGRPQERLQLLLSPRASRMLPLTELYFQVLTSAFPVERLRNLPEEHGRLLSLLNIISLKRYPLTPHAIASLGNEIRPKKIDTAGLPEGTTETWLSAGDVTGMVNRLRAVLILREEQDAVRVVPIHATSGDFLLDDSDSKIRELYHVDRFKGHASLSSACLAAMSSFDAVTDYLESHHDGVSIEGQHVRYAAEMWIFHLKHAGPDPDLRQQLQAFVSSSRLPVYSRIIPWSSDGGKAAPFISLCVVDLQQYLQVSNIFLLSCMLW